MKTNIRPHIVILIPVMPNTLMAIFTGHMIFLDHTKSRKLTVKVAATFNIKTKIKAYSIQYQALLSAPWLPAIYFSHHKVQGLGKGTIAIINGFHLPADTRVLACATNNRDM